MSVKIKLLSLALLMAVLLFSSLISITLPAYSVSTENAAIVSEIPLNYSRKLNAQLDAENVDFVGQIGGATLGGEVQDNYAYMGEGPRLVILDVSDPLNPIVVGKSSVLSRVVEDVAVWENYAYVAVGNRGLRALDVSNPTQPVIVGEYMFTNAQSVYAHDGYVYMTDHWNSLQVVDTSDPTNLEPVGSYSFSGNCPGVAFKGDYAYIANSISGLEIVSIVDPTNPFKISLYEMQGKPQDVAVAGDIAYVADYEEGLHLVSINNPTAPSALSTHSLFGAEKVIVSEGIAYVVRIGLYSSNGNLWMVDVSNPTQPVTITSYEPVEDIGSVIGTGDLIYVLCPHSGLRLLDVANPATPIELGTHDSLGRGEDITVVGSVAYVAAEENGLQVIDVSDPSNPTKIRAYDTPGRTMGLDIEDQTLFVADGIHGGLRVMDATVLTDLVEIGYYDTPGYAQSVSVTGTMAYVADSWRGLRAVDVSDLANPTEVGSYEPTDYVERLCVDHNIVYVSDDGGGIGVVDVSEPISPTEIAYYDAEGSYTIPVGVEVSGTLAYVAAGSPGLQILEVSDPANPTLLGSYTQDEIYSVAVSGTVAYATGNSELHVLDVQNPVHPIEVGNHQLPGGGWAVTVRGEYVYVTGGESGLMILRRSTHSIFGEVQGSSGNSISDVSISFSRNSSTTTDFNGAYFIPQLFSGTYNITPTKPGWVFSPTTRIASVPPDANNQDFIMLHPPISIMLSGSGTISYVDTQGLTTTLVFPEGSLNAETSIVLTPTVATGSHHLAFAGTAFDIEVYQSGMHQFSFTLNKPVTVTIHYSEQDVDSIWNQSELTLQWWNGSKWLDAAETCNPASQYVRDEINQVLSVPICHLSRFGLFGPAQKDVFLPLVLRR